MPAMHHQFKVIRKQIKGQNEDSDSFKTGKTFTHGDTHRIIHPHALISSLR